MSRNFRPKEKPKKIYAQVFRCDSCGHKALYKTHRCILCSGLIVEVKE